MIHRESDPGVLFFNLQPSRGWNRLEIKCKDEQTYLGMVMIKRGLYSIVTLLVLSVVLAGCGSGGRADNADQAKSDAHSEMKTAQLLSDASSEEVRSQPATEDHLPARRGTEREAESRRAATPRQITAVPLPEDSRQAMWPPV